MSSRRILPVAAVLVCLLTALPAQAHKVNIFAYEDSGVVYTESYFVDGTPCLNARVTALAPDGGELAGGMTDEEGLFSFPVDGEQDLRIVLEAGQGHRGEILLAAGEMTGETPSGESGGTEDPSSEELERMLDRALDKRLKPVHRSLARLQQALEKPRLSEILGGIGFIIGLAGAFLWGASRRRP